MNRWQQMMIEYGSAHQNRVNVWMHITGVPVIVYGVLLIAAAVQAPSIGPVTVSAAWAVVAVGLAWYRRLDRGLTRAIAAPLVLMGLAAQLQATASPGGAAVLGTGLFIGGFVFQFIGHAIEGRKPALLEGNPIVAMLTAPLFIVAELHFMAGRRLELEQAMQDGIAAREAGVDAPVLVS